MKKVFGITALLCMCAGISWGYSGSAQITVSRTMAPLSVSYGNEVSVSLTAAIGSTGGTIRGFFVTDYIPGGYSISNVAITQNGTVITSKVKRESLASQVKYPGYGLERFVFETPTTWAENNPVDPMTTIVISYKLLVPSNAATMNYALPGFSWVAMITSQGDAGDIYGYEDSPPTLSVTGSPQPVKIAIVSATSSTIVNGNTAAKAIDGIATSRWESSSADNNWIVFNLGQQYSVKTVVFVWEAAAGKTYKVQGSNDSAFGGTPVELYNYTGPACGARTDSLTMTGTGTFRYIRMLGLTRCLGYGYSIFEARMYSGQGTPVSNPPTVATAAAASPTTVTAKTTALSVLGADDKGESALLYTWATTGTPPAAVTFSANGTNGAKNTTVAFAKAGTYSLQVSIKDAENQTVTSSVTVTVNQTATGMTLTPASTSVGLNATQQFVATVNDQFGNVLAAQPAKTWSVSGGGTISASGLFTAGNTIGGPYSVTVQAGSLNATASVTVTSVAQFSAKVNFQTATTVTPAGYVADAGSVYASRGNGYTYGWTVVNTANARERNSTKSPDKRYDTFNHMQRGGANSVWEIAVPNGTYSVRIVAGDPGYIDSYHKIAAEGIVVADGQPTATAYWIEGMKTVTVTDGKLTVTNATGANNNKIDFIDIVQQ